MSEVFPFMPQPKFLDHLEVRRRDLGCGPFTSRYLQIQRSQVPASQVVAQVRCAQPDLFSNGFHSPKSPRVPTLVDTSPIRHKTTVFPQPITYNGERYTACPLRRLA